MRLNEIFIVILRLTTFFTKKSQGTKKGSRLSEWVKILIHNAINMEANKDFIVLIICAMCGFIYIFICIYEKGNLNDLKFALKVNSIFDSDLIWQMH